MTERLTRAQQQQRTRERLLDAAETLFGDRGIHQTSLDEIAAAAGLTKGAIYANFGGKKDLIAAILDRRLDTGEQVDPRASLAGWAAALGASFESTVERPETRRFGLAFIELWLYGMREEGGRAAVVEWLRAIRELNGKEATELAGADLPMPAEQLAALMTAVDIGVAIQHYIDPEAVPTSVYRAGLEALIGKRTGQDGRSGGAVRRPLGAEDAE
jgi:AcrR family transcriptional regulator